MQEWWSRNRDSQIAKMRERYPLYYEKNASEINAKVREYVKTEAGKQARRTADANQKLYNAKKVAARQIVRVALVGGLLTKKPCEQCGAPRVEAHHEDYDKPLEVIWLCRADHQNLHRSRKDGPYSPISRDETGRFAAQG